jgi:hypothetical protein
MADYKDGKWGAKTPIGDAAAQAAWNKNWAKNESKEETLAKVEQAKNEADDEVKRETRGKKAGGSIRSASTRADGIAQRGKTKGRMV